MNAKPKTPRRQILVLTREEKKAIAFVLCAFVLGVATKHYRDTHPRPPRPLTVMEERAAKKPAHLHQTSPSPLPTKADRKDH